MLGLGRHAALVLALRQKTMQQIANVGPRDFIAAIRLIAFAARPELLIFRVARRISMSQRNHGS